ncbi:Mitochondrial carrier protein ymc2 [Serendipita sp. 411]|nr:Mitochondrial carrier protein ymc2 [Serendipita sp. 398]KAG8840160.1 Mitochondrial carrier protein ymc2 [Serendipita sp. 411]
MQTAPPGTYSGMVQCAGGILKNEGPLAFYKGTLSPLLGVGACVSIQFGALEYMKRVFQTINLRDGSGGVDGKTLSPSQLAIAGASAGLANSIVSGPVEHIRIRLQTQSATNPMYKGPLDAVRKIFAEKGIAGLYKGQIPTLWREGPGYASYFVAYELLMQREMATKGIRREEIAASHTILYGAIAGYALWFTIYPADVIKSRMQTDGFSPATGQKYTSTMDCVRKVISNEGIAGFRRGLVPTLIRSPFANGATFVGFELAMRMLNG